LGTVDVLGLRRRRTTKTDEIPMEFWKITDKESMEWLIGLFIVIFKTEKMQDRWR